MNNIWNFIYLNGFSLVKFDNKPQYWYLRCLGNHFFPWGQARWHLSLKNATLCASSCGKTIAFFFKLIADLRLNLSESSVCGYKNGTGLHFKRNILIQVTNNFQSIHIKHRKFFFLCAFLVISGNCYLWAAAPNEVMNMIACMNNWLIIRTQSKRWLSLIPSSTEKKSKKRLPQLPSPT